MVSCECCDNRVLEIKCFYKYKDELPTSAIALSDCNYCLKQDETEKVFLSRSHQYYDQVQGQMAICNMKYCDFVCWTTKGIFVEHINMDQSYFTTSVPTLKQFFHDFLLQLANSTLVQNLYIFLHN